MKFKTLMAVAVAGAFAVPLAALAQGAGGTTTAPSADHPQGNPPYTAPAGSQDSGAVTPGSRAKSPTSRSAGAGGTSGSSASWDKLDKNKDGYLSREELKNDNAMSGRFSEMDKDNDGRISKDEFSAHSSGAGATGSTGSTGSTMGAPKSPSSGGPASGTGSKNSSTDPK